MIVLAGHIRAGDSPRSTGNRGPWRNSTAVEPAGVCTRSGNTFLDKGALPLNPNGDAGDPVLARDNTSGTIYFATLRRDNGWQGTRNGTLGIGGGRRYYFFAHNRGSASPARFGPGSLYLLPPDTFEAEQPLLRLFDTAHLVSRVPVRPLARIDVTPEDFPFRDRIGYYRDGEPAWISLLRG